MEELLKPKAADEVVVESRGQSIQLIVFKLGKEEYGLNISQIKEVVPTPPITGLPQTPPYIKGVANIRGKVIAMVDLMEKLGLHTENSAENICFGYSLVVESEDLHMGILVHALPNTLTVYEADLCDPVMVFQDNADHSYIKGIVKQRHGLLMYIDILRVMEMETHAPVRKEVDTEEK